jgi:hypothetical protein
MHQLKLALQDKLAPGGTLATLCDALLVPFTRTFLDERGACPRCGCRSPPARANCERTPPITPPAGTHRARLQEIGCVQHWTDQDWLKRLGPLSASEQPARKALIQQQNAEMEAARKAAAAADGPRSRSGARPAKPADWSSFARGAESPAEATAEAVPAAEAAAVAVAEAPAEAEPEAAAGSGGDADAATQGIARTEKEDAEEEEAAGEDEVESAPSASDSQSAPKGGAPGTKLAGASAFEAKLAEVASPSPAKLPAAK